MLENLAIDSDVELVDEIYEGGSGNRTLPSGVYPAVVSMAMYGESAGGAKYIDLHVDIGEITLKSREYVTSKAGSNTYFTKAGTKKLLPGMQKMESLSRIVTGKSLSALATEERVVKTYSFEAGKEVPTKANVIMDLLHKPIQVGIYEVTENKKTKTPSGSWVPTNDRKTFNELATFFDTDGKTATERASNSPAAFVDTWKSKFAGKAQDRFKTVEGMPTATSPLGVPPQAGTALSAPPMDLFA